MQDTHQFQRLTTTLDAIRHRQAASVGPVGPPLTAGGLLSPVPSFGSSYKTTASALENLVMLGTSGSFITVPAEALDSNNVKTIK